MYSILLLLPFLAFYCFYLSDAKTKKTTLDSISAFLCKHPVRAKTLGYFLVFVSWIVFANLQGLTSGSFALVVYLMGLGSLFVLLTPYSLLNWKRIGLLSLLLGIFELSFSFFHQTS